MIQQYHDGRCCVSSHQQWLPGCYENERAAKYAFRFTNKELQSLQDTAKEENNGIIRFNDMQNFRNELREKHSVK